MKYEIKNQQRNEPKSWLFVMIHKINKHKTERKKQRNTQITSMKNGIRDITANSADI